MSTTAYAELITRLDNYTKELDGLVDRMQLVGFPFSDAELIYSQVSGRLKDMLKDAGVNS